MFGDTQAVAFSVRRDGQLQHAADRFANDADANGQDF
jgi:hypothetical protein